MNRKDIEDKFPEECEDELKEVLDHFEDKFNEIKDLLNIGCIDDLDKIADAYKLADETAEKLY